MEKKEFRREKGEKELCGEEGEGASRKGRSTKVLMAESAPCSLAGIVDTVTEITRHVRTARAPPPD